MEDLFNVRGKVAVVTGGSRGIGEMIATGYVKAGMKVYITSRKSEDCRTTARRLSEFGESIAIPGDMSSTEGINAFVTELSARESTINVLVNNAGATWGAKFADFPESGWDRVFDLNVKGLFFLTQKLLPLLRQGATPDSPSRVINIASVDGTNPPAMDNYSYSASKAAVIMLTRHLAKVLVREGIIVNSISPGAFRSKMTAAVLDAAGDQIIKKIPNGRIGSTEDIAGVALFLASRASQNTIGANIPCDGGFSMLG